MEPEVRFFSDPEAWVEAAAELVFRTVGERSGKEGRVALALAGGNTPRPLYERLGRPPYRQDRR
ncbi:MAG: 6-phosphogluconolactonase, partial [Deltaproteobacteria bacterium]|nr:6-phosphogluconolactonase [Deltaproteobacteria bacterium]